MCTARLTRLRVALLRYASGTWFTDRRSLSRAASPKPTMKGFSETGSVSNSADNLEGNVQTPSERVGSFPGLLFSSVCHLEVHSVSKLMCAVGICQCLAYFIFYHLADGQRLQKNISSSVL